MTNAGLVTFCGLIKVVFDAIRALMVSSEKPRKQIGFEVKEPKASYGRGSKWKASSSPPGRMG